MHGEFSLPFLAKPLWVLGIFGVLLLVFHVTLVGRLSKIAWKRMDYIWLGVATLGLIGAVTEVRRLASAYSIQVDEVYIESSYSILRDHAKTLASEAVCRRLSDESSSSSNLAELQKEYDAVCLFGKRLYSSLPSKPQAELGLKLVDRPHVKDEVLQDLLEISDRLWTDYSRTINRLQLARLAREKTSVEKILSFLSPILISAALALRITKVTGEIRLG